MQKDFDSWNKHKKATHENENYLPHYHEREIRWCKLGANIGHEQDGTGKDFSRPVLILKGFSRKVCIVIPLTTSVKVNHYRFPIGYIGNKQSSAIISQIRLIDVRRLDQKIAILDKQTYMAVRKAVRNLF